MKNRLCAYCLAPCSLRLAFPLDAQQPAKVPRVGISDRWLPGLGHQPTKRSDKDCESSVTSKGKISSLSVDLQRETRIGYLGLRPNSSQLKVDVIVTSRASRRSGCQAGDQARFPSYLPCRQIR